MAGRRRAPQQHGPKLRPVNLYFLYFALRSHDLGSLGADSAVPGLNRNIAYMSKQVTPDEVVLDAFERIARPIFAKRNTLDEESRTLAALRDTLFPKLLSGELRVPAAERALAGALPA